MCDRVIVLARHDHRRWISCCEHGMAHLAWDNISIRLPIQKLEAVSRALQECGQVAQHFRIAGTDEVCVILDEYDLYQIWLGGIGLCLAPEEFRRFCQLLNKASAHPAARMDGCEAALPIPEAPIRTTYHLFSLN